MTVVTLRYFAIKGRAQPLRDALEEAALLDPELRFEDVRITLADWRQYQPDPEFSGPYGSLPTLRHGAALLAETLPITNFLSRELGLDAGLSTAELAHLQGICSCCYLDVTHAIGMILWSEALFPGTRLENILQRQIGRMCMKLSRLDALVPAAGTLGQGRPNLADFFLLEAREAIGQVLGPERAGAVAARWPRLTAQAANLKTRPALAAAWPGRPELLTGSPLEPALLERIWKADLSALGW